MPNTITIEISGGTRQMSSYITDIIRKTLSEQGFYFTETHLRVHTGTGAIPTDRLTIR